ncbi:beta-xylosidase family glycoside hydrolase [Marinicrinis sediminis]
MDAEHRPEEIVPAPDLASHPFDQGNTVEHFDEEKLDLHFSTLREPMDESWISLRERKGYARIRGRQSLQSGFSQSLIAKRQTAFHCEAETSVEFEPHSFQQMAGLVVYYNTKNYYYLHVTWDENEGKCLQIAANLADRYDEILAEPIPIRQAGPVYLKASLAEGVLQFAYSMDGIEWVEMGQSLDASLLSDECATVFQDGYFTDWGFTGTFIGISVQDLTGTKRHADFDYFRLEE